MNWKPLSDTREDFLAGCVIAAAIGVALAAAGGIAFGVLRLHEGTWLCDYLLCLR